MIRYPVLAKLRRVLWVCPLGKKWSGATAYGLSSGQLVMLLGETDPAPTLGPRSQDNVHALLVIVPNNGACAVALFSTEWFSQSLEQLPVQFFEEVRP